MSCTVRNTPGRHPFAGALVVLVSIAVVVGVAAQAPGETGRVAPHLKPIMALRPVESSEMVRVADEWTIQKHDAAVRVLVAEQANQAARARAAAAVKVRAAPTIRAATPVNSGGGCAYSGLIHEIFGAAGDWATSIAWRESRCDPGASNSSGAHGLFQMLGHHDIFVRIGCLNEFDPTCNARAAFALYQGSGAGPWRL